MPLYYIIPHVFYIVKEMKRHKMKICAIICEYNPFHNGHLYQLSKARELSGADFILCLMSGNFVQRGEEAIAEKRVRAKHAILAGADAVLELPTVFATSNAELFAKGAVHILSSIPAVKTLCFGAEYAEKTAFLLGAKYLNDEPKEVSEKIKAGVSKGESYAKARAKAFAGFIPFDLLSSPNNILGLEYTRAILSLCADIQILPIQRVGANYGETALRENFSSASAIRQSLLSGENVSNNLPDFVLSDLSNNTQTSLETLEKYALLARSTAEIKSVPDCTEGLENALKRVAEENAPIESLVSARYTASRLRRIALQNLLTIDEKLIRESLSSSLYLRVLAIKKNANDLLSLLSQSAFPLLIRSHDEEMLAPIAKRCYEKDVFAEKTYAILKNVTSKERTTFI